MLIDNLAVTHWAASEAHTRRAAGSRIIPPRTVKGVQNLAPGYDLPHYVKIDGPNPAGEGVWQGSGVRFRWDERIPMRN